MLAGSVVLPAAAEDNLLAFPGAEGGGKYTTGARGAEKVEVYHVTNLEDDGAGSLRDAISQSGRIVVFDVGGVINIKSRLNFDAPNVTVLGQTAPGDGITITGYDALVRADNVILRYLRVRPSDSQGAEPDALGGRWIHDVILDHCSVSWGVDEMLTLYAGSLETDGKTTSKNITVQYCISSESLRMSNHIKGAHGYGGIIGGEYASYHHNLFAHNDSRNPRFDRNLKSTDMVNNIIYNWGNNSAYGAEPYSYSKKEEFSKPELVSHINIRNNYYKYGPNTKPEIRSKIFEATNDMSVLYNGEPLKSDAYISGNYVYGFPEITENNTISESAVLNRDRLNLLDTPISMGEYEINMESAENAYETVLATVGASLPRRDATDARLVADVKNGTGRIINRIEEVGGFDAFSINDTRVFEIPAEWKAEHGMGNASNADIAPSGYTWIEEYVNDWTAQQNAPSNPQITVNSPSIAKTELTEDKTGGKGFWTVVKKGEPVRFSITADNAGMMLLYDGDDRCICQYDGNRIEDEFSFDAGTHYITAIAANEKGEKTTSDTMIVYVTDGENITEIGDTSYPGKSYSWRDGSRTYISGSGRIDGKEDSFAFDPEKISGDFSYMVRIDEIPKYENGSFAGIMVRDGLDADSRMVMLSDTWKKYGENIIVPVRAEKGGELTTGYMPDSEGKDISNASSYDTNKFPMPKFMKVERKGDKLILSVSDSGVDFKDNARQPLEIDISGWSKELYVGLAVDSIAGYSNEASPLLPWYTIAAFTKIDDDSVSVKVDYDENGAIIGTRTEKSMQTASEASRVFIF